MTERPIAELVRIVERIMTQHWDMAACRCWVCVDGRAAGCRPREQYLAHNDPGERPMVTVLQIDGADDGR